MTSETQMGYYWAICQCPWGIVSQSPTWLPTPQTFSDSSGKRAALSVPAFLLPHVAVKEAVLSQDSTLLLRIQSLQRFIQMKCLLSIFLSIKYWVWHCVYTKERLIYVWWLQRGQRVYRRGMEAQRRMLSLFLSKWSVTIFSSYSQRWISVHICSWWCRMKVLLLWIRLKFG